MELVLGLALALVLVPVIGRVQTLQVCSFAAWQQRRQRLRLWRRRRLRQRRLQQRHWFPAANRRQQPLPWLAAALVWERVLLRA